ncbi:MAG TPA: PP2C family protein-serine/threonine phosphatase [Spirillospora sp.]|nr:PP2C family protein-serine/threonine phosphatase [Spirillospora sp.]
MGGRRSWADRIKRPLVAHAIVVIALAFMVAITVTDLVLGTTVHLGPFLVIAPALAASMATVRLTAVVAALAVADQVIIAILHGGLTTTNHLAQISALTLLSLLIVFLRLVRERRERALGQARSVAETAQRALLRPPPERIGPLRVAWLYLTAQDESQIGGDLFAVTRASGPASRVLIGDVRGKGLDAIAEASVVLGAFREGARRYALPALTNALQDSVDRDLEEVADTEHDLGEHFITALVLDVADDHPEAEMISCGHPPPLLLHDHRTTTLAPRAPAPPLGVPNPAPLNVDRFTFAPGDMLVLYTDGVIEARSPAGDFYPLAERVATFPATDPATLLDHIHRDLLAHTADHLADDAALLILKRADHPA